MKHKIKLATRTVAIAAIVFTAFSWNNEALFANTNWSLYEDCPVATDSESCTRRALCIYQIDFSVCVSSNVNYAWPYTDPITEIEQCEDEASSAHRRNMLDCFSFFGIKP